MIQLLNQQYMPQFHSGKKIKKRNEKYTFNPFSFYNYELLTKTTSRFNTT